MFSSRPKVVDDFSGRTFASLLRMTARIRNLDGPDDLAGAASLMFSQAHQPYVETALLGAFFPLVAGAAVGAVKSAQAGYAQDYPDSVRRTLDQQARLIDALREGNRFGPGESNADLQPLIDLHLEGRRCFDERQQRRDRGAFTLLKHNLQRRWHGQRGNGALSRAFNEAATRLIAERFARNWRLDTVETSYQAHLLDRCERERRAAKRGRVARLFTGLGMPGMAGGMAVSTAAASAGIGASVAQAGGNAAVQASAQAAQHGLEAATGGVMFGAQFAQGVAGALNGRLHAAEHRQLRRDRDAVQRIAADLPARVQQVYAQDTRARLADSARSQVCDALLSTGQGLMMGASASSFACPPLATALAVPGALLTVGAAVGTGLNEAHREAYLGAETAEPIKADLRAGNLGARLRGAPLGEVLREVGDRFVEHQDRAALTRLWCDVAQLLQEEADRKLPPQSGEQRYRRLQAIGRRRLDRARLLPAGQERLETLRQQRFPAAQLEGPLADLHERLAAQLREHPAAAAITALPSFRQEVFFATVRDLARWRDPMARALFQDGRGRRLKVLTADDRFTALLAQNPGAHALYQRHHNAALARHLLPVDRFGRAEQREALTDLAHVTVDRTARHDATPPPLRQT